MNRSVEDIGRLLSKAMVLTLIKINAEYPRVADGTIRSLDQFISDIETEAILEPATLQVVLDAATKRFLEQAFVLEMMIKRVVSQTARRELDQP